MGVIEPLIISGVVVYSISQALFSHKTVTEYMKHFIEFCIKKCVNIKKHEIEELIEHCKIIDKGLIRQRKRIKKNHIDRHLTGTIYRPEIERVMIIMQKINKRASSLSASVTKNVDLKIKEFDRRISPLLKSVQSQIVY